MRREKAYLYPVCVHIEILLLKTIFEGVASAETRVRVCSVVRRE